MYPIVHGYFLASRPHVVAPLATKSCGTLDWLRKSRIARLFDVPSVLNIANTRSCCTSWRTACTVRAGSYPSSRYLYSIFRPFTPPRALTYLKYASAPRAPAPADDPSPESGAVPPIRIESSLTPGSAAEPARAAGTTTRARRQRARFTEAEPTPYLRRRVGR